LTGQSGVELITDGIIYRFTKTEITALAPVIFMCEPDESLKFNTYRASPEKALYVLLSRLAYPARYYSHTKEFGRSISWHSEVFLGGVELVYELWSDLIHWRPQLDDYEQLQRYAQRMGDAGWGGGRIWGAIDGTFIAFCRPEISDHQLATYNGYYGTNGMKFQSITTPDGLVSHISLPFLGPSNDWDMYTESGVVNRLQNVYGPPTNRQRLFLFGDNAYRDCYGIIPPFYDRRGFRWLPEEELEANHDLSSARIIVEQGFGKVEQAWTYNYFGKSLREAAQPVAAFYLIASLRCRDDLIAKRFDCQPPTVGEYLGL
jgi:DDE superfamily endonuclease